jgi:sulfide:quinone oxidoreductase
VPVRVLVAGGGVAALETLIGLHQVARDRVALTLLAPDKELVYRPLATGDPFAMGAVRRYDLAQLAKHLDARRHVSGLGQVDPERRVAKAVDGTELGYDVLMVAIGAVVVAPFAHAQPFHGPDDTEAMHGLVQDVEDGYVKRIVFVIPPEGSYPLPAYELALLLAGRAADQGARAEVTLVSPEAAPLEVFGEAGSAATAELLEAAGVRFIGDAAAEVPAKGRVRVGTELLEADRVIALPRLEGPRIAGLPHDEDGFIPVDERSRVRGVQRVYAAGDATDFPVKQGGIATQQADAALQDIAAWAGADVEPEPFRPVLRGMLLTGTRPRYLRHDAAAEQTEVATRALWWPPSKIAGRYLSPFLGYEDRIAPPAEGLPLEVALEGTPAGPVRRRAIIVPRPAGDPPEARS